MAYRKNLQNKFMIGSIGAEDRQLVLTLYQLNSNEPNRAINAKERCPCDVYAERFAKFDDNHAYRHHAVNRRSDLDR